jgi:porphobilinogen deaminase
MRLTLATLLVIALAPLATATAAPDIDDDEETEDESGLVLVNAAAKLGDLGQIDKLRKVLDSRGLLHKLPRRLEAALDGRALQIGDVEAIKDAYANDEFDVALKMIGDDEVRILKSAAAGDPLPALAELAQWRGLIEAKSGNEDEAIHWFRAAHRFNSARRIDKQLASPTVRTMMKKARKEAAELGRLRVDAEPETAMMQIDGQKAQPTGMKVALPVGFHLVTVTAKGRTSYSEIIEILEDKVEKFEIALDKESSDDKAAKLVDATVSAAPGKARLKLAKKLSRLTGNQRYLVIEGTGENYVTVRFYDVSIKKVSRQVDLLDTASSATIARLVNEALDPESMIDATQITVIQTEREQRWYERWYVWVGVGAVIGGGVLGYQYMSREPTAVRF